MAINNDWNNSVPAEITSFNSGLNIDTSGRNTNNLQPAFLALAVDQSYTAMSTPTTYTVKFAGTKVFDNGNNFLTPNFTVPVTGIYYLEAAVELSGIPTNGSKTQACFIKIANIGAGYMGNLYKGVIADNNGIYTMRQSIVAKLTASTNVTVVIQFQTASGSVVLTVVGAGTSFAGYLIC